MLDHYAVLGLSPKADDVVIHAAWKALLRKYHPDISEYGDSDARAREINAAFAIIGNAERRRLYDQGRIAPVAWPITPAGGIRPRPVLVSRPQRRTAIGRIKLLVLAGVLLFVLAATFDVPPGARSALAGITGDSRFVYALYDTADQFRRAF